MFVSDEFESMLTVIEVAVIAVMIRSVRSAKPADTSTNMPTSKSAVSVIPVIVPVEPSVSPVVSVGIENGAVAEIAELRTVIAWLASALRSSFANVVTAVSPLAPSAQT